MAAHIWPGISRVCSPRRGGSAACAMSTADLATGAIQVRVQLRDRCKLSCDHPIISCCKYATQCLSKLWQCEMHSSVKSKPATGTHCAATRACDGLQTQVDISICTSCTAAACIVCATGYDDIDRITAEQAAHLQMPCWRTSPYSHMHTPPPYLR